MSPIIFLRRAGGAATGAPAARTSPSRTTAQAGPWGTRCPVAGSVMSPSSRASVQRHLISSSGSTAAWRSRSAPRTSARRSASAASPRQCCSWWTDRAPWGPRTGWWRSRAPYCRCSTTPTVAGTASGSLFSRATARRSSCLLPGACTPRTAPWRSCPREGAPRSPKGSIPPTGFWNATRHPGWSP